MELESFIKARPMLFHTGAYKNFDAIHDSAQLCSTEALLRGTPYEHLLSVRRPSSTVMSVRGRTIVVRDQRPLRIGSLRLQDMTLEEWIRELNRRVFFWPGTSRGPISQGRRHFDLYAREDEVFALRVPLAALIEANPGQALFVSTCNSGSARHQRGQPVARGRDTYRLLESASISPYSVVEVSFVQGVDLPDETEFARQLEGPWYPLLRTSSSRLSPRRLG